jgi:hypothetical protein
MFNVTRQCKVEFGYQLSICSRTKENLDLVGRSEDFPDALPKDKPIACFSLIRQGLHRKRLV